MTKGSEIHDQLGDHVKSCVECRKQGPARITMDWKGCQVGKHLWVRWVAWLKTPD